MINKFNNATGKRPEGDRLLNAPLIKMDLNASMEQLRNEPAWKENDRNAITMFKSEKLRIVLIGLHEGAELKTHTAEGTISVQVLEGNINFNTEQQSAFLNKGQMISLQEKIPHSVVAAKESFFLLTLALCKG